jgi:hypothetical protein
VRDHAIKEGVRAGLIAGVVSGAPSTLHALATGGDPLEATLAAGSMALPDEQRTERLLAAAVPVHLALSAFWGVVLARALPRRRAAFTGTLAGLAIGGLDLLVIGPLFPRIRALPKGPQFADHIAFGITAAYLLDRSE